MFDIVVQETGEVIGQHHSKEVPDYFKNEFTIKPTFVTRPTAKVVALQGKTTRKKRVAK